MLKAIQAELQNLALLERPLQPMQKPHAYGFVAARQEETIAREVVGLSKALITAPATYLANRQIQKENENIAKINRSIYFFNRCIVKENRKQLAKTLAVSLSVGVGLGAIIGVAIRVYLSK